MARVIGRIALQVAIATVLTVLFGWVLYLFVGAPAVEALTLNAIPLVLGFVDIGIITWLVLLIVGAIRTGGSGWGFAGSMIAALIGTIVNLVWIVILSALGGGVDGAAIALGVQAGVFFLIAAAISTLIVRVLVSKPGAPTSA